MVFAIGGLVRGSVRQVFGLVGFAGGLWVAILLSRWVGAHWAVRPVVVLWAVRWLVAAVAALAIAGLFHIVGSLVGKNIQAGPAGTLDRLLGFPVGAAIGLAWAIALVTLALLLPGALGMRGALQRAHTPRLLVELGARTCEAAEAHVPGLHGLARWIHEAERRTRTQVRRS